ncbi:uncharacterized protein [Onthophagus taurus]|uniref:uncharacterized protein isoform X1 n=1 Tax=Onthophagus taurus TaxID=166361 RepID=UPI0039BE516D
MSFHSKLFTLIFLLLFLENLFCVDNKSTVKNRENVFSRKKRYLTFPKGANFVYQAVFVKVLMKKVPKGIQWLTEFDVPFPLPTDTSLFKRFKHGHKIHRRQLFEDISTSLDGYGLNGTACVQRMVCEAKQFVPFKGKSLVKDLLSEVFLSEGVVEIGNIFLEESCDDGLLKECPHPLLDLMWGSFTNY